MAQFYTIPPVHRQDRQITASDPRTRKYLNRKARRSVRAWTRLLPRFSRLEVEGLELKRGRE